MAEEKRNTIITSGCITLTRALETTSFENIPAPPTALSSLETCSEFSELEEEDEDIEHEHEETHEQPSAMKILGPRNAPTL